MVLAKDGDNRWVRSCEKLRSIVFSQREEECPASIEGRKANWIGHILHRNCLPKHVTEVKIEGGIEMRD